MRRNLLPAVALSVIGLVYLRFAATSGTALLQVAKNVQDLPRAVILGGCVLLTVGSLLVGIRSTRPDRPKDVAVGARDRAA